MPLLIPAITDTLPRLLISLGIFHTSAVCLVVFVVCGSELNGFIYFLSLRICICIISFKKNRHLLELWQKYVIVCRKDFDFSDRVMGWTHGSCL